MPTRPVCLEWRYGHLSEVIQFIDANHTIYIIFSQLPQLRQNNMVMKPCHFAEPDLTYSETNVDRPVSDFSDGLPHKELGTQSPSFTSRFWRV